MNQITLRLTLAGYSTEQPSLHAAYDISRSIQDVLRRRGNRTRGNTTGMREKAITMGSVYSDLPKCPFCKKDYTILRKFFHLIVAPDRRFIDFEFDNLEKGYKDGEKVTIDEQVLLHA